MRALLVFDKFKDSLTARQACLAAADGLAQTGENWIADACPLTDGGEGFAGILTESAGGTLRHCRVNGPRGAPVDATFGEVPLENVPPAARARLDFPKGTRAIAVVEMAQASGLALLDPADRDLWHASSTGTGELMREAALRGAQGIVLGVGGSATNDLGLGALSALGVEARTSGGDRVQPPIPARWADVSRLAGNTPPGFPPVRIACDVANPLLGPSGCAAIYGPQKGLRPSDRGKLETESARIAGLLVRLGGKASSLCDTPGAGAAGGIAFGLMAAIGATLLPGFDLVSSWLDLDPRIAAADVVITGEGRFDDSSLSGKGPGAVALRALQLGKPAHVFAGQLRVAPRAGLELHAINPPNLPLADALAHGREHLAAAVRTAFAAPATG